MKFTETYLKGAYEIEIDKHHDDRGFFGRAWCLDEMKNFNLNTNHVQTNFSYSIEKGTIRGLHFQRTPYRETKLLRCTKGSVFDVIIDLRPDSKTFGKWFGTELSEKNHKMIYVPENFAHGFVTLEDNSEVYYMVTEFYNKESEIGIRWDDPSFNINWPIGIKVVSEKDKNLKDFDLNNISELKV